MDRLLKSRRCPGLRAALAALFVAAGCGPSGEEDLPSPSTSPVSLEHPVEPAQTMSALPSRTIAFDHFALEGAMRSPLSEPDGVDGEAFTTWALRGDGVELRMEVSTWFSQAEAEASCSDAAGDGAELSMALRSPTWATSESVYVTQEAACVRVTVLRGRARDQTTAMRVAALLIEESPVAPDAF